MFVMGTFAMAETVAPNEARRAPSRKMRSLGLTTLIFFVTGMLTTDSARERFEVRCDDAGLPRIHPHQLRHTWAADFLANGGQERDAMRLAGWRSDSMLSRYGSATADARAAAAARRLKRGDRV